MSWEIEARYGESGSPPRSGLVQLLLNIRTTANCRYKASVRLERIGISSFWATTLLSLGLILIPLLQNSGISLALGEKALNMLQIFLAVAVLVYSVATGKARYDIRAAKLLECGDALKKLGRELEQKMETASSLPITVEEQKAFDEKYYGIVRDFEENQNGNDYRMAKLEMPNDYPMSGFIFLKEHVTAWFLGQMKYLPAYALIVIEILFITEMLGITPIINSHLGNHATLAPMQ